MIFEKNTSNHGADLCVHFSTVSALTPTSLDAEVVLTANAAFIVRLRTLL